MSLHVLNRIDPLSKQVHSGMESAKGLSPMDPPDAYAPPNTEPVPPEELHPFLRRLCDEHRPFTQEIGAFEEAIAWVQRTGYTREADAKVRHFFDFFEREFVPHHRQEEQRLFPLLHERLLLSGEHGTGVAVTTAVDVMVDEHAKAMQLAAVIVNFLGLVFRLPDDRSRMVVLDATLEESRKLIELLRLHIFRENVVVFSLAHRLILPGEFDAML